MFPDGRPGWRWVVLVAGNPVREESRGGMTGVRTMEELQFGNLRCVLLQLSAAPLIGPKVGCRQQKIFQSIYMCLHQSTVLPREIANCMVFSSYKSIALMNKEANHDA